MELFSSVSQVLDIIEFAPREVIACNGNKMLASGHERARVKATNRYFETEWVHVFTVEDGKIIMVREFYDTAAIAAAFRGN